MPTAREVGSRGGEAKANPEESGVRGVGKVRQAVTGVGRGIASVGTTVGKGIASAKTTAVESVSAHPAPAILIGAGVAWLLMETFGRRSRLLARAGEAVGKVGSTLAETAGTVGEAISGAAGSVKEGVAGAAETVVETVREGAGHVAEYAQTGVSVVGGAVRGGAAAVGRSFAAVGRGAQRSVERGREAVAQTWQNYPLSMGVATLAVGLTAGLLLPRSRREQALMGKASAAVSERVRSSGKELVNRGKRAASAAVEATTREARRVGLAPKEVGRKIRRIAAGARDAMSSAGTAE